MRTRITLIICLCLFAVGRASAQWAVIDPSNIAQSIVNTSKNVVHTSTTAQNMIKNFQETVKIYEQGKKYYDALKSVNNLVKDARKVQQTILMVGDITDTYVTSFQRMILVAYELRQPSPDSALALRADDAAMRGHGGRGERHRRAGCAVLRRLPGVAVAGESRTDRRVPHAAPVCDRLMYHVLPDGGIRYDKQHHVARRAGHGKDAGGGNAGHEPIP